MSKANKEGQEKKEQESVVTMEDHAGFQGETIALSELQKEVSRIAQVVADLLLNEQARIERANEPVVWTSVFQTSGKDFDETGEFIDSDVLLEIQQSNLGKVQAIVVQR